MYNRLKVILFLFFYIPAVLGVGFSSHYCGGELVGTKIFTTEKQACCDDETEAENGCCDNEIHLVKIKDNQFKSGNQVVMHPEIKQIDFYCPLVIQSKFISQISTIWGRSESPPHPKIPIILQHRQLII